GRVNQQSAAQFLTAFGHLVASFPPLIALAAARVGENSRVVLAENLFQECGNGDVGRTHYAIFRNYLHSIGIVGIVETRHSHTNAWRTRLWEYILAVDTPQQIIGATAAGEFLAQPALRRIYEVLNNLFPNADVEYFTKHLELEGEHVTAMTMLIVEQSG